MSQGREKAEEWLAVCQDFADDLLASHGEEAVEAFWTRLDEYYVHRRSVKIVDAVVSGQLRAHPANWMRVQEEALSQVESAQQRERRLMDSLGIVGESGWEDRLLTGLFDTGPLRVAIAIGGAWIWLRQRVGLPLA
jgi:hypothetical protein